MGVELQTRILLLVEDNPADAELVQDMLSQDEAPTRYEVHRVEKLADAEELLRSQEVDLVLLDLLLPDAMGVQGVRTILEISNEIPIVVLTGMSDEILAQECVRAGAQDYLTKDELKPAILRRSIGYSITRMREAQLRSMMGMLEQFRILSNQGVTTSITATLAGVGPMQSRVPEAMDALIADYEELLSLYIEQLHYKKEKPTDRMVTIMSRIGDLGGGPRDLVDIHVAALEAGIAGASTERARAIVVEGRLLALEMMGLLVDYYRTGSRRLVVRGGGH